MGQWINYHSHTEYCDGAETVKKYAEEALRLGLPAYGYSSHAPVAFDTDWCIPDDRFPGYLEDVREVKSEYAGRIQLYLGLEIDYIPGIAGRNQHLLKDTALDYYIGSVHFVDAFADGTPWNIDTAFDLFQKGLRQVFDNDYRKAATRYYELTREMICQDRPDVIGHIDKIKMFNQMGHYFHGDESWYRDQIDLTIRTLKEHDSIVEVNTRGYYKYGQEELYPSQWIIERMDAAGIRLMINSDSHNPNEITEGMEFAARELKSAGVQKLWVMLDGEWQETGFDETGYTL